VNLMVEPDYLTQTKQIASGLQTRPTIPTRCPTKMTMNQTDTGLAMSDCHSSIDRTAWQRTFRGVQEAAYLEFPACGKNVCWRDVVVSRFQDGLIAEEWFISDLAEQLLLSRKK
jgi:hypothetical protein